MPSSVHISTPSRLHFGLLRLEVRDGPSFGGLGMMIDRPGVTVELSASDRWTIDGPSAERAREATERALAAATGDKPAALQVRVIENIPLHRGLGGGTQLALAMAAGVRALTGLPPGDAATLAQAVGRAERSAVGSHGFVQGGLIWELGRRPGDAIAPLAARVAIPEPWRVVLVTPRDNRGLSGHHERAAFEALPPIPAAATEELVALAEEQILPAAISADFDAFGEGVYQYGRLSGQQFAAVQGGPYASEAIAQRVAAIRARGIRGVGQSSWGPTVFAFVGSRVDGEALVRDLATDAATDGCEIALAAPENRGARIRLAW